MFSTLSQQQNPNLDSRVETSSFFGHFCQCFTDMLM